jgi:hypothetical protein
MANWDIVALGPIAALIVLLGGTALGIWEANEFPDPFDEGFQIRVFLRSALSAFTSAALIVLLAEVADRLWRTPGAVAPAQSVEPAVRDDYRVDFRLAGPLRSLRHARPPRRAIDRSAARLPEATP